MLSFKDLKYKPQGIIHIGAHLGEEKEEYGSIPVIYGLKEILVYWVDSEKMLEKI